MSENIAIDVKQLSKTYHLYEKQTDRVKEIFHPLRKKYHRPFHALTDVSFQVEKGEFIGIIGKNGSGKSTLLQLICGILQPSSGSVRVNGRISALLELGAGFNPEFSGRENVFLNATILGLSREEIHRKFDEIIAFADIGEYIEQPVKLYSSGMVIRLAFAVTANIDPNLLVVDEALAVGDSFFQAKCIKHMKALVARGVTILYVTHAVEHVPQLCNRAIYLKKGRIEKIGRALPVTDAYLKDIRSEQYRKKIAPKPDDRIRVQSKSGGEPEDESGGLLSANFASAAFKTSREFDVRVKPYRYGTGGARVKCIELLNQDQQECSAFGFREQITVRAHIQVFQDIDALNCCLIVRNKHGIEIMHCTSREYGHAFPALKRNDRIIVDISFENILKPMQAYTIHYTVNNTHSLEDQQILDLIELAAVFDVKPDMDHPIWYLIWHPFKFSYRIVG